MKREKAFLCCRAFAAFFESRESWQAGCGLLGMDASVSREEYDILLKGVYADVFVPLWASAAMGDGHPLMDETTLEVIRFYKRNGFEPRRIDGNPPDYIGEQFAFLAYLYGCAGDPGAEEEARAFEDRFTVATVRAFASALGQYPFCEEVASLAEKMKEYLAGTGPEVSDDAAAALYAEEKTSVRNPAIPVEEPHLVMSAGLNNCGGKCKINITAAEGCALRISTDDSDNDPQIRACVRGRSYRRTYLTPKRLRYPMKRIGARGEGKFKRISWAEAAKEIADMIRVTGEKYGPESRFVMYATGNCAVVKGSDVIRRILNLNGGFLGYYNSYSSAASSYVKPYIYGASGGGNTESDMLNSKLLILWGHNPAETIFGSLRNYYLAEAKTRGIPIIVIDPRQSDTALALADEWIPIRPSTDGALAVAMAYVIVEKGLHDLDFLHRFCLGFDEETLPEGAPEGSSYLSYLLGVPDGIPKTPAWGESVTGVPAETIERLAVLYASTKPAAILPGLGPQRHGNGEQGTRAIAALACLTGNVGRSGGSAGVPGPAPARPGISFPKGETAYPGLIPSFLWPRALCGAGELTARKDGLKGVERLNSDIRLLFNIAGNILVNQHSDINKTTQLLRREDVCDMIVVSDVFMTPSARYADILLPAVSLLECNNITMPWNNDDHLMCNARAVDPLFETMPDYEWGLLIAEELGVGEAYSEGRRTQDEWLEYLYAEHMKKEPELPDYETFRKRGGWQYRLREPKISFRENIENGVPFRTPSGKIELYSERIGSIGDPELSAVPAYIPAPEGPEDIGKSRYPLQLIGYHTKRRCHSIHDNNPWLEEVDPPALWIHPEDAAARGIADGQMIEAFNDRGIVVIPAKVTGRIMKGVVAMSQGGWYTPDREGKDRRGSINVLTQDDHPTPLAKGNPQHTNLVDVRPAEG